MSGDTPTPDGPELEAVIGLEVHVQLGTESKLFCGCSTRFGARPNSATCPTCLGLPGALPVFNERALELALRLGVALGCTVAPASVFARKNYFYPDLPKGYQVSQYDRPLAQHGRIEVARTAGECRTIRITRIHLEEDAGKSLHDVAAEATLVDYNRSGVPLAEVVTEPDFRAPEEAHAFLASMRQLVRYLGISDGNMEEGSLRCDCNVSLRRRGGERLGTKVELKNLNSFRSVLRALEHEIRRQAALLAAGDAVEGGTRLWDERRQRTRAMRRKEEARDYRYFPDPDLLPVVVSPDALDRVRAGMPELPWERRRRFVDEYGLGEADAGVLTAARRVADYFEELVGRCGDAREAAKWVQGEVLRELNERQADPEAAEVSFPVSPRRLAELIALVRDGAISRGAGKTVFAALVGDERSAAELVEELGLAVLADEEALRAVVRDVLAENARAVEDYRTDNPRALGFLVGQVMKVTAGRAEPALARRLLQEELDARR